MDSVIKGLIVYLFLLVIFRFSGKRTLAQTTNFDLVLLLIISETTQQAMVDNDHSITNAFLLIMTLIGSSILLSFLKQRYKKLEQWLEGLPLIIMEDGKLHKDRMKKDRVDESDVLNAARLIHGIENLDQIKYAIIEKNGEISIVPNKEEKK
ncbi:MAG TPA: YetF domain-containing protein [Ignavibacteriaceae bacterium]|nr:YetF domain-containing protein [Ignavibacteriaceae bacterium]